MPSSLAAALMGRGGVMPSGGGMPEIPLASLLPLLMKQDENGVSLRDKLFNGFGNMFRGYQWDGMAGGGMLNDLSSQAAGNIAGGAAGL